MALFVKNTSTSELIDRVNENVFKNKKKILTISKIIEASKEAFNKDEQAQKCFEKYYNVEGSKYYHLSAEQIKKTWDLKSNESKKYGKSLDNVAKLYLTSEDDNKLAEDVKNAISKANEDNDKRTIIYYLGFDYFIKELKKANPYLEFVDREKYLYLKTAKGNLIRGRFDALFYNPVNKKFAIFDWKNSLNIKTKNKWNKMINPFCSTLDDCNYNDYLIQLNFYKRALKTFYTKDNDVDIFFVKVPGIQLENWEDFDKFSDYQPFYSAYNANNDFIYDNIENIIDYVVDSSNPQNLSMNSLII